MFYEEVHVDGPLDALDTIGQVRLTLDGLSEITCDMANSPNVPDKSLETLTFMLVYLTNALNASEKCLFDFYRSCGKPK